MVDPPAKKSCTAPPLSLAGINKPQGGEGEVLHRLGVGLGGVEWMGESSGVRLNPEARPPSLGKGNDVYGPLPDQEVNCIAHNNKNHGACKGSQSTCRDDLMYLIRSRLFPLHSCIKHTDQDIERLYKNNPFSFKVKKVHAIPSQLPLNAFI